MDDVARRREFRDWLPFHVNGTLDASRSKEMEDYMDAHPGARDEYLFARRMAQAARLHGERRDPMAGYDKLKARLDASRPAPSSLAGRWRARLRGWGLSPALGLTMTLAGVQLALTAGLLLPARDGQPVTRGVAPQRMPAQIKLVVRPGAAYVEVMALLHQQRCRIVWGPGAGGEIWLALDEPRDAARVREALAASPLVEDVLELAQP